MFYLEPKRVLQKGSPMGTFSVLDGTFFSKSVYKDCHGLTLFFVNVPDNNSEMSHDVPSFIVIVVNKEYLTSCMLFMSMCSVTTLKAQTSFPQAKRPLSTNLHHFIFISPLFNQVGQLRQVLIYNCDLAKMKQSSATKTTAQSCKLHKQMYSQ